MANKGVVFLTGATGGIGSAIAKKLTEQGYTVLASVRSKESGIRLKKEISQNIVPIEMDITVPSSVQAGAEEAGKFLGNNGIDGLINNAGCIIQGPLELLSLDEIKFQFDVNVFGQIAVTQALLPFLRKNSGRVINIGAVTGKTAMPFIGALSASKHAMEALTDALRVELKPWNIHVTMIEPAAIDTSIFEKANAAHDQSLQKVPSEKLSLYESALAAYQSTIAKQPVSPTVVVVKAVTDALTATKPKTRYAVGRGASLVVAISHLPDRLRDRLLMSSLGLSKVSSPKQAHDFN